jgi:streptolysin S family bacteriocin protoxin
VERSDKRDGYLPRCAKVTIVTASRAPKLEKKKPRRISKFLRFSRALALSTIEFLKGPLPGGACHCHTCCSFAIANTTKNLQRRGTVGGT